jgi:Sigma-70 region 2
MSQEFERLFLLAESYKVIPLSEGARQSKWKLGRKALGSSGARSERVPGASTEEHDNGLVKACQRGDNAAWEDLVNRHRGRIYGLCYRFTRRRCEAHDLTQEVFLRVFRRLRSFREGELSLVSWLTVLTRNLLVDHIPGCRSSTFERTLINEHI